MDIQTDQVVFLRRLPLLWLSLAFLAGIASAFWLHAALWLWLLLAGFVVLGLVVLRQRLKWQVIFALLATLAFFLGAARYQSSQPHFSANNLAYYNDSSEWVEFNGIIFKPPVLRDGYIELRVSAYEITVGDDRHQADGLVLTRVDLGEDWKYGDRILLQGRLQTPDENDDFSYRAYLARQGIHSLLPFASAERLASGQGNLFWAALYAFRDKAINVIHRLYPDPAASLFAGILLGDESGLSESLKTAFNDTGTRHIIAISGFNISIIAGFLLALFSHWLGLQRGIWLTVAGVGLYTLLVGAEASVVRAAIMGVLALVARRVGRQQFALNTLAISAALMALINPLILWDVGFQLSFAATLGLIVYAEPIRIRVDAWLKVRLSKESAMPAL